MLIFFYLLFFFFFFFLFFLCSILISADNVLKISDFGVSRQFAEASTKMTFVGTVAWMAPEVIRHENCSEKVDVWSYGVLLWEILMQEKPYNVRMMCVCVCVCLCLGFIMYRTRSMI